MTKNQKLRIDEIHKALIKIRESQERFQFHTNLLSNHIDKLGDALNQILFEERAGSDTDAARE